MQSSCPARHRAERIFQTILSQQLTLYELQFAFGHKLKLKYLLSFQTFIDKANVLKLIKLLAETGAKEKKNADENESISERDLLAVMLT